MVDKSTQIVVAGLSRAAAEAAGLPLQGTKSTPGLFAGTAPGRQAAQRCKDEGYLRVIRSQARGKTVQEICAITEKGLAYLLSQVSPKAVLEQFVRALEGRQAQVGELVALARQTQASFESLKATAEKILHSLGTAQLAPAGANGSLPTTDGPLPTDQIWLPATVSYLAQWQAGNATEDCPLPELHRQAQKTVPTLTIGQFHDGLRRLQQLERIYLHPWTGPLYEIPEPLYALLVGHDIAYYASLR